MISSSRRRVVITGCGIISPLGNCPEDLWTAIGNHKSGVRRIEIGDPAKLPVAIAASASEFTGRIECFGVLPDAKKKSIRKSLKLMCRETQMGVAAAQLAWHDSGLAERGHDPERTGVIFGSDYMLTEPADFMAAAEYCSDAEGFRYENWGNHGMTRVEPLWLLKYLPNMPASHIAIFNDFRGPSNSLTHREGSSNLAVSEAARIIERGHADVMLAGATGTKVHPMKLIHAAQQEEIVRESDSPESACRPFDTERQGAVCGEGSGVVVLESLEHAQRRGAAIRAEVAGTASCAIANRSILADRRQAISRVIQQAINDAAMKPHELGHIHAHGLGTRACDRDEALAIRDTLGDDADRIPVIAYKSYFGNLGAGSGLVEMIASLEAMKAGFLFPVRNLQKLDTECPIFAVQESGVSTGPSFMNLNITPLGQASAIIVRAAE